MKKTTKTRNDVVIYAAGPIDLGTDIPNWRRALVDKLRMLDIVAVIFDPSTAFKLSARGVRSELTDRYIEDVNKAALYYANIVVAVIPKNTTTVGTPIEINMATESNIPVKLLTNIPYGASIYLNNRIPRTDWHYIKCIDNKSDVSNALNGLVASIANSLLYPKD